MNGIGIIFQREISQFFASPIAYLLAAAFFLLTGLIYNNELTVSLTVKPVDPSVVPVFLSFAMVFFAPLLTMRLLAEESREGTLELVLTSPISETGLVFGKFLSAWAFYSLLLLIPLMLYQAILLAVGSFPDLGHTIAAYIGIWLYGGAALATGVMFSALTENQIVAAFLSMSFLLLMFLGDLAGQIVASVELANLIRKITLQGHFSTSFAAGLIRAEDIAYFAGMIVIMLFITIRVVESRRWR